MSKNIMKIKNIDTPPWPQWPSCIQPTKTLSFRCENNTAAADEVIFKTLNQSYLNTSSEGDSFSSTATLMEEVEEDGSGGVESIETVIRGLRSTERLFFEPGETSSLLIGSSSTSKEDSGGDLGEKATTSPKFKDRSVVCAMESNDPYLDFKKSMEEMVEAHGLLKDWDCLEELLCWYLKVNGKSNHGYIVGAFVDLLIGFSLTTTNTTSCSCSCSCSTSSPMSYTCSSSNVATTTCSSSSQS